MTEAEIRADERRKCIEAIEEAIREHGCFGQFCGHCPSMRSAVMAVERAAKLPPFVACGVPHKLYPDTLCFRRTGHPGRHRRDGYGEWDAG